MIQKLSDYIAKNGDREIDSEKLDEVLQIKQSKVWNPENGEQVWFLSVDGDINNARFSRANYTDQLMFDLGFVKRTKKECEELKEYLTTKKALQDYAKEHNEGKIDWKNENQKKYCLNYFTYENYITVENEDYFKQAEQIYFTSIEIAQAAIAEIGKERIKQYLLYEG